MLICVQVTHESHEHWYPMNSDNSTVYEVLTKYDPNLSRRRRLNYGLNKNSIKICHGHFIRPINFSQYLYASFAKEHSVSELNTRYCWKKWFMHQYLTLINVTECP